MAKNEDFETSTGKGGETHQQVPKKGPHSKPDAHLTTNQGIRVSDNQNSLRAGASTMVSFLSFPSSRSSSSLLTH
jgi:catalase